MPVRKKTKVSSLGRAIINSKNHDIREKKRALRDKNRDISLIPDPGLSSILDVNSLDDFLETTALAERSFEAERGAAIIVDREAREVLQTENNRYGEEYDTLQIPRRPKWTKDMTAQELDHSEKESFLVWRRNVAHQVETSEGQVAPFEKNIEVWRQLWRVLEMSDVIVQIVDARNPLLFRCPDLEQYAHELDPLKKCILIINKADLLTVEQRNNWGHYFDSVDIQFKFFSAKKASEEIKPIDEDPATTTEAQEEEEEESVHSSESEETTSDKDMKMSSNVNKFAGFYSDSDSEEESKTEESIKEQSTISSLNESNEQKGVHDEDYIQSDDEELLNAVIEESKQDAYKEPNETDEESINITPKDSETTVEDLYPISNREQILQYLETEAKNIYNQIKERELNKNSNPDISPSSEHENSESEDAESIEEEEENNQPYEFRERKAVVGMVGFPNVGKSSLINVLIGVSPQFHGTRVAVGPTPGKTKHFQTILLSDELMLCDCPGLVFPVFMNTKADLIFNGILPVSNLKDHISPMKLVCQRIPRAQLERVYHISLPRSPEDPPNAAPSPRQLLRAYCTVRGFMASNHSGVDEPKGARCILKDVLMGVLVWCCPPPPLGVIPENPQESIEIPVLSKDTDHLPDDILLNDTTISDPSSGGAHKPRNRVRKIKSEKKNRKYLKRTGGVQASFDYPHINGRKQIPTF